MEQAEFEGLATEFRRFAERYGPLFGGWAAQDRGEQYLRGLLVGRAERRNAENLAEQVEGATPRALQRFLTEAPWGSERVIGRLQEDVAALLEAPEGVWIVDETGVAKQGTKSAGVARQYSGTLGQVGNCQVGVFLGYASDAGRALVDARLYPFAPLRAGSAGALDRRSGALSGGQGPGRGHVPDEAGTGAGDAAGGAGAGAPAGPLGDRRRGLRRESGLPRRAGG